MTNHQWDMDATVPTGLLSPEASMPLKLTASNAREQRPYGGCGDSSYADNDKILRHIGVVFEPPIFANAVK